MDVDMVADAGNSLWSYVATSQKPTSIGQALKCSLGGSDGKQLVVRWANLMIQLPMARDVTSLAFESISGTPDISQQRDEARSLHNGRSRPPATT